MGFFDKINIFKKKKNKINNYEDNLDMLFGERIQPETIERIQEEEILADWGQKTRYVENCCEQIVACTKHMENAKKEYKEVNDYLNDIKTLEELPYDIKDELEYYAKRVVVLGNEKTGFKKYATSIPEKVYVTMQTREKEMPEIIKTMAEDEQFCEDVKKDLTKIEGEKLGLKYDRRNYMSYVNAMRNVTVIGFIAVVIVALAMMSVYFKETTSRAGMNILIISIIAAAFVIGVFIINRSLMYKLKVIEVQLNKLIGISNKIKLKYVNVRVKLDYEYNIYQVENAYELSKRYKAYLKSQKEREAFARAADTMYQSMNAYSEILKKVNLHDHAVWNSQISAIINPNEMMDIKTMLEERKERLKHTIEYNGEVIENTKNKIKKITMQDKAHAKEILEIISRYEDIA